MCVFSGGCPHKQLWDLEVVPFCGLNNGFIFAIKLFWDHPCAELYSVDAFWRHCPEDTFCGGLTLRAIHGRLRAVQGRCLLEGTTLHPGGHTQGLCRAFRGTKQRPDRLGLELQEGVF